MFFPVIVKPTDSAGSKGVMRVDSFADLELAFARGICSFSSHHRVIVGGIY